MFEKAKKVVAWVGRKLAEGKVAVGVGTAALAQHVFGRVAQAEPTTIDLTMPDIVDWSQVVTTVVAYVGGGLIVILGAVLAFRVAKILLIKLTGTAR